MKLLGLTGTKQSGKDTVYSMLVKQLSPRIVQRIGFADALKQEIATAIGKPVFYIETHKNNFRLIMQGWGTDFRRQLCGDSYWTDKLLQKLVSLDDQAIHLVVVTDVRFLNEAELIQKVGGKIWRIVRGRPSTDAHASETELAKIKEDYTIYNNHSLAELDSNIQLGWQQTML